MFEITRRMRGLGTSDLAVGPQPMGPLIEPNG